MFKIHDKKSIVSNYDLTFDLGSDQAIGNMYAIQAMSGESQMYPMDNAIDGMLATDCLGKVSEDGEYISYVPDMSDFRASQMSEETNNSIYASMYGDVVDMLETNSGYIEADYVNTDEANIASGLENIQNTPLSKLAKKGYGSVAKMSEEQLESRETYLNNLVETNVEIAKANGFVVTSTLLEYFQRKVGSVKWEKTPSMLPFKLSLTTYGISSLTPGDIFRVDYLPKMYRDNVYIQVTAVNHSVDSSGWNTTLETHFRHMPNKKFVCNSYQLDKSKIVLSPKWFETWTVRDLLSDKMRSLRSRAQAGPQGSPAFDGVIPLMTKIKPTPIKKKFISKVFVFTAAQDARITFPGIIWWGLNRVLDMHSHELPYDSLRGYEGNEPITYQIKTTVGMEKAAGAKDIFWGWGSSKDNKNESEEDSKPESSNLVIPAKDEEE